MGLHVNLSNFFKASVAFCFILLMISCSGDYVVKKPIDLSKGKSVYIEDFSRDRFNIKDRLEFELSKMGFNPTSNKDESDFILKWQYIHAAFGTNASVQLINNIGETVYLGEGDNPGWGTLLNKTGATWGCFERALQGLYIQLENEV